MKSLSFVIGLFFCLSLSSAEFLKFEKMKLEYKAGLKDKGTSFVFKFTNVSGKEITVEKIKSSCSCMTIKSHFPYKLKNGQESAIEAHYDFTGKVGFNRGNIELVADGRRITLNVEVDIPVPVTINPRFIIWKKGERDSRDVAIKIHPEWKGKIDSVKTSVESIKTELIKSDDGHSLKITPPSVQELSKKRTRIFINGKDEEGKHIEFGVYLILN